MTKVSKVVPPTVLEMHLGNNVLFSELQKEATIFFVLKDTERKKEHGSAKKIVPVSGHMLLIGNQGP